MLVTPADDVEICSRAELSQPWQDLHAFSGKEMTCVADLEFRGRTLERGRRSLRRRQICPIRCDLYAALEIRVELEQGLLESVGDHDQSEEVGGGDKPFEDRARFVQSAGSVKRR